MTPRKVHYWLNKGMLGQAIRHGSSGTPTLLSFEQLLRVQTLQRLRDELVFTLSVSKSALEWLLENLLAEQWRKVYLFKVGPKQVGLTDERGLESFEIWTGQMIFPDLVPQLNAFLERSRRQWEQGFLEIQGFDEIVSDPRVLAGSPVIEGTRIETAFVANLAAEESLADLRVLFPKVSEHALIEAARFEEVQIAA